MEALSMNVLETKYLNSAKIADIFSIGVNSVRRLAREGKLPPPIYIGSRMPRWKEQDVILWLQEKEICKREQSLTNHSPTEALAAMEPKQ
jgi:predicted DNA-binding transcriptional regulator AlpA